VSKETFCPKCHASLPPRGRFCLECGLDLYEEGVHSPPRHIIPVILFLLLAAALATYIATRRPPKRSDPEKEEVSRLTNELLALVQEKGFATIVARYYKPDKERYERVGELLREIVRGRGAPGLNLFESSTMNDPEEADKFVKRFGTEHPEYVAGVLAAFKFNDGALRAKFGTKFGAQRTEDFVAWYLSLAFGSYKAEGAKVTEVSWQYRSDGPPLMVARIQYRVAYQPVPGVADPVTVAWLRRGKDAWTLELGIDELFNLPEVLDLLSRVKI
jgi:hypothetical protein